MRIPRNVAESVADVSVGRGQTLGRIDARFRLLRTRPVGGAYLRASGGVEKRE